MPRRYLVVVVCALLIVSTIPGLAAMSNDDFALQVTPSVDVPDRTTTFDGTEYDVTAIGRVSPGNDIEVAVTAPEDTTYNVHLYNGEKQIVDSTRRTGEATLTFTTDGLSAGSYTIALERDGQFETVHPVVISGYRVTIDDAPSSIEKPDDVTVSVSLTTLGGGPIERVELVIADADDESRVTLDETDDQAYQGSVSTGYFSAGSYRLYAVVRGTETVEGTNELLGISDAQDLRIEPEPTPTTTTTTTDGGGASGGSSGGDTTTTTLTTTTTSTSSNTTNTTTTTGIPNTTTSSATTSIESNDDPTKTGSNGDTSTNDTTSQQLTEDEADSDDVIAPNEEPTDATPGTPAAAGVAFGVFQLVFVGLVCLFLGTRLRR